MALRKRSLRKDIQFLKWQLVMLLLVAAASLGFYLSASMFRNEVQRLEFGAVGDYDLLMGQIREIEEAERIIVDNIDRFNSMLADGVLEEEDRVQLLQAISNIRDAHQLFPITVEVSEQERVLLDYPFNVEFPDEQISLRSSRVQVRLPLLHEEDLTRFLADFLATGRLLMTRQCNVSQSSLSEAELLNVVEHQVAACEFYWYTFRREAYTGS